MIQLTSTTLGVICDDIEGIIRTGPFGSQLHQSDYKNEGLPVVMPKDIVDRKISVESIARIGNDDVERLSQHRLEIGDIVYGRRGDIGRCALIAKRENGWLCGTGSLRISLGESVVNPKFLYYYLGQSHVIEWICNQAIGSTLPNLNTSIIRSIPIIYPTLKLQIKIGDVLSAYDDLIENNTRRIKILEKMAQLLYREWFVNFRFPGHEEVKLVESPIGLIPEGWEVSKLEDLGSLSRGKSRHRPRNDASLYGGDYPFIQTGEVKQAQLFITEYTQTYNELGLTQSKLWEPGTLLITIAANIAETSILTFPACFPDSILGFVPDSEKVSSEFIKYSIDVLKIQMQNASRGTTQDNLSQDKIRLFNFLVPSKIFIQKFGQITQPIFQQIRNLLVKNGNLRQTRDLLLPKLISGEIDVEALDLSNLDQREAIAA
jgi:type I restriction enzyme, S subunit